MLHHALQVAPLKGAKSATVSVGDAVISGRHRGGTANNNNWPVLPGLCASLPTGTYWVLSRWVVSL